MEENRNLLRHKAQRLVVGIYILIVFFVIGAYIVMNDFEKNRIVTDTQMERAIASLVFMAFWTSSCIWLFRNNMQIFDTRSLSFDTREADHHATKETVLLREQFMANMSHEIRTPLNAIIGFSSILKNSDLNERDRELTNNIQISSENLLNIVNDILDISKIEAGMLLLEEVPFDPEGLFHSVQQMFLEKARQKNLTLEVQFAPNIPYQLIGDPTRLTQILVNLIGNAIKFTEKGSIVVSLTSIRRDPPRGKAMLYDTLSLMTEVRDTGIGIPQEHQTRIFDRFTQTDEQTTRIYGGTGLGLSIVKQLVEAMDGRISIKSELGKGSVFAFRLPFKYNVKIEEPIVKNHKSLSLNTDYINFKILVAEDNPMNRRVVELLFESWNFSFVMVKNGREAIDIIEKNPKAYQLILMDIQMPEMDGYEATQKIRLKSNIPIVAMTAHALAGEREKCLELGMNDYISKPIREHELRDLIVLFMQKNNSSNLEIDLAYLNETTLGNAIFQQELAKIFIKQTPIDLEAISAALSEKNARKAAKEAHNMKSTVGYMGFASSIGKELSNFEVLCLADTDVSILQNELAKIEENVGLAKLLVEKEFGV
jgi:signal transduction histidine kinase/CheY-like chemotaxis protein